MKRLPSEEEGFLNAAADNWAALLTPIQREKLSQFFAHLVDTDRDDVVSRQDFENLSEVSGHRHVTVQLSPLQALHSPQRRV